MSNRGEIRSKLRTELKIDPNGKVWSDSVLNNYINSAYLKVQKDGNFKWRENDANTTFSTVIGTQEYTLPTDFIRADLVRYNNQELFPRDKTQLKREVLTFVAGQPSRYYLYGSNIGFDVLPQDIGTIDFDYRKKLATFTADTDESELPEDFDDIIVKYAAYLAWSSPRGNEQTAAIKLSDYGLMLDTLLNTYIYDISDPRFYTQRRGVMKTRENVLDRRY